MVKRVSSRSNGLLTQNRLSDEVRCPASGPPEVGPFFGSLGFVRSVRVTEVRSFM